MIKSTQRTRVLLDGFRPRQERDMCAAMSPTETSQNGLRFPDRLWI